MDACRMLRTARTSAIGCSTAVYIIAVPPKLRSSCRYLNHAVSPSRIALLSRRRVSGVDHDPPLKLYGIPARYANATYSAASKAGQLEVVQRDLDAFQHVRKPLESFLVA